MALVILYLLFLVAVVIGSCVFLVREIRNFPSIRIVWDDEDQDEEDDS